VSESGGGLAATLQQVRGRLKAIDLSAHEEKILLVLALVVSAIVGLVVVAFVVLTERMGKILLTAGPWQRLLSPFLGALVGGWLLYYFFPDARGSGIPQTRVALILNHGIIRMRTVFGKFLCSSISLGSGVALGREGPTVQIGAGIVSTIGRRLGLAEEQVRSLIPVGTAAAIAAAFNTPLAAVLFTLEEILDDLHARLVGTVVIGAATSWIVLRLMLGDEPLFHVPAYQLVHPVEFFFYALLGLAGGLVSTAFVKLLLWQRAYFLKVPQRWQPYMPAVGGLTVGLLALAAPGVLGVGYNLVSLALNGQMAFQMMLILLVLKLIATSNSYAAGNAGGIFGPSLFIGAMLGGAVGHFAHILLPDHTGNAGAYALVGMGAAFAGIIRTPMTSVIMIFEVTRDYTIIVPLMIANLCSYLLAQRLHRTPIYEALSKQDGITMPSASHLPEPLIVERAMRTLPSGAAPSAGLRVHPDDPLDAAMQWMGRAGVEEVTVVSRAGEMPVGSLRTEDALNAYHALSTPPPSAGKSQNWLAAAAVVTLAAVLLVSGLGYWQHSRRASLGQQAYKQGLELLAKGQSDDAVLAFRNALAQDPADAKVRAGLGLALVQSGHFEEASSYLSEAAKAERDSGPVFAGLARIAEVQGRKEEALGFYRQAAMKNWTVREEGQRRRALLDYVSLLAVTGKKDEAVSLLQALIEQQGGDSAIAKRAAQKVREIGSPEQIEQAYVSLTAHFPADAGVWLALGDARYATGKDRQALDAYRKALAVDPGNAKAQRAVQLTEQILSLDPTRRGLSLRERAGRWNILLQRVVDAADACGVTQEMTAARQLLNQRTTSLEATDRKMDAALAIWHNTRDSCRTDPVLEQVISKIRE
jgi:chloride channel protein, CIC family